MKPIEPWMVARLVEVSDSAYTYTWHDGSVHTSTTFPTRGAAIDDITKQGFGQYTFKGATHMVRRTKPRARRG